MEKMMTPNAILNANVPVFTRGTELKEPKNGFGPRFMAYAAATGQDPAAAWSFGPVPFHAWLKTLRYQFVETAA